MAALKVLFIGGTGLISSAVSALAVQRGFDLTLLNRGTRSDFAPAGARQLTVDLHDHAAARAALKAHRFDVVVNWIAYTPDQVRLDLELFAGAGHYVFISSASAYQKPPSHPVITESTPLANPYWQYSRDKIACEELLNEAYRQRGFPMTIVRPSLTYGPTQIPASFASWNHPWTLVDRMRRGLPVVVPGDGSSLWTMTHNSDFALGFLGLLGNVQALGHSFHITSDEVLTWDQIYQLIGRAAGVTPDLVHLSSDFIAACVPEEAGGLLGDKARSVIFDNTKIKRLVPGFTATTTFGEGVAASVAWFEAHPERRTIDAAFHDRSDRLIRAHQAGLAAFR